MRCSAYEGCQEGRGFIRQVFLSINAGPRGAQRSGAESRARAVGSRSRREPAFVPRLRPAVLFLKASGLLSFCSCVLFARRELRACLIGVAALSCVGQLAPRTSSYPDS